MATGLFTLSFIRLAVNFAPFYICLREPSPSILFVRQLVSKWLKYTLLANSSNTIYNQTKNRLTTAAKYIQQWFKSVCMDCRSS